MAADGEKVAVVLVDALRYEMAADLVGAFREPGTEVTLKPRLAELPTITAVGMNVLAPVVAGGKLAPSVLDGRFKGFSTGEFTVRSPEDRSRAMGQRAVGKPALLLPLSEVCGADPATQRIFTASVPAEENRAGAIDVIHAPAAEPRAIRFLLALQKGEGADHGRMVFRQAEFADRIGRASGWLLRAVPRTTEDRNMQLMGLKWSHAEPAVIERLVKDLTALQRNDGGWAQTPELSSDAYATGQTLYALHEAGVPATDPVYRRGVEFLARTQKADGSWQVVSRVAKFQPYFQSAFPYDHDQWISNSATAYAVMALAPVAGK